MSALDRSGAIGRRLPWLVLAGLVIGADQLSKEQVLATLQPGASVPVTDFFNLVLAFNRGAAFSFLNGAGGWQTHLFTLVGLAASAYLVLLLGRPATLPRMAAALALILGGALGNVIDRLRYGHVVDFLDFHVRWLEALFPGGHFPAFNVADSAISCGAALLILDELLRQRRRAPA